jgi:hypothetical protein
MFGRTHTSCPADPTTIANPERLTGLVRIGTNDTQISDSKTNPLRVDSLRLLHLNRRHRRPRATAPRDRYAEAGNAGRAADTPLNSEVHFSSSVGTAPQRAAYRNARWQVFAESMIISRDFSL